MNAYYLWDSYNSINVGQKIEHGPENQFLVKVSRPNGLQTALTELSALAAKYGKKHRLEIHCHGGPGTIHLGGDRAVTNHNVKGFGSELKAALLPGGLIEVLACLVASQEGDGDVYRAPKNRIEGYRDDYHGALRLVRTREYNKGMRLMSVGKTDSNGRTTFGSPEWQMARTALPHYGGRFTQREEAIQDDPLAYFRPEFEGDGLRFCLDLAVYSGCTVRAACRAQTEEGTLAGNERLYSPIGNWEFEVFDFNPDGMIQFLGSSPYRGPINSFDMVQRFPAA